MNQLDDYTRRALCAADQPPPGVEDRVLAAILGPIGGPGPDGGGGLTGGTGPGGALGSSTLVHAVKIVGTTLGLAAGGVALLAITAAGVRAVPDRGSQPQASARVDAPIERREPSTVAAVEAEAELEAEPLEAPMLADAEPAPAAGVSRPAVGQAPSKPATVAPEATIEAELALMKTARTSKDHELALATLDRHRREFATGVFAAEREVLRVEHLCALGRTDEAETVAAAFVARHPANPLRSRVDPACAN